MSLERGTGRNLKRGLEGYKSETRLPKEDGGTHSYCRGRHRRRRLERQLWRERGTDVGVWDVRRRRLGDGNKGWKWVRRDWRVRGGG